MVVSEKTLRTLRRMGRVLLAIIALGLIQHILYRDMRKQQLRRDLKSCLDSTSLSDWECDSCWTLTYEGEFNLMMEEIDNVYQGNR